MNEYSPAELLVIEHSELSHKINELKDTGSMLWMECEEVSSDDMDKLGNCIAITHDQAKSEGYGYGVDLSDICGICQAVLDTANERKKLTMKRGYVKNQMHSLAKKLKAAKK